MWGKGKNRSTWFGYIQTQKNLAEGARAGFAATSQAGERFGLTRETLAVAQRKNFPVSPPSLGHSPSRREELKQRKKNRSERAPITNAPSLLRPQPECNDRPLRSTGFCVYAAPPSNNATRRLEWRRPDRLQAEPPE